MLRILLACGSSAERTSLSVFRLVSCSRRPTNTLRFEGGFPLLVVFSHGHIHAQYSAPLLSTSACRLLRAGQRGGRFERNFPERELRRKTKKVIPMLETRALMQTPYAHNGIRLLSTDSTIKGVAFYTVRVERYFCNIIAIL